MESPYAARESEELVSANFLAKRLRAFERNSPASSMIAPGSVAGLEGRDLEEFVELLEPNFDRQPITRVYEPYGSRVSRHLGKGNVAVLLRGVVEIQAPFGSEWHDNAEPDSFYPVAVLRAPALIGLFEVIPEASIRHHQVQVFAGVQSFAVLLSLAQLQPWKQIARRHSTKFSYRELTTVGGHTTLFRWPRGGARAPRFVQIAQGRPDWHVELALLDVGAIFTKRYDDLDTKQRRLRDLFYRFAVRQFGDSLKRHVPGYRRSSQPGATEDSFPDSIHGVASFVREVNAGEQPHHTCCSRFDQLCNLLPAKTLIWNIYDFVRLAAGQSIDIAKFNGGRRSTADELKLDVLARFFNDCLYRYIYVPSFCASEEICLYSPVLWPYEDKNSLLRDFDPNEIEELQSFLAKKVEQIVEDLHIKTVPDYFKETTNSDGWVPKSISEIVMEGGMFFRKRAKLK